MANVLDTDAAVGIILSNFSSEYIEHVMIDSLELENRFRPFAGPLPNFVDILQRQLTTVLNNAPDYRDQVLEVTIETYKEVILHICNKYNLQFCKPFEEIELTELYGIARTLYDIFVSNYTTHFIDFVSSYIINNADFIISSLQNDPNAIKPKEVGVYDKERFVDPKYILLQANIITVINNMASYDIPLDTMLSYFLQPSMASYLSSILTDVGDIFKNHYAICILDNRYKSGLMTNVQLNLQSRLFLPRDIETA